MSHPIEWNQLELAEHIRWCINQNPVLRAVPWSQSSQYDMTCQYGRSRFEAFQNYERFWKRTGRGIKAFRWMASKEADLHEGLRMQLQKSGLAHGSYVACDYLISLVDEYGYLQYDAEQVMAVCHVTPWEMELAEGMMKSMKPVGVCSRNLEECRQIQREEGVPEEPKPGVRYHDRKMTPYIVPDIIVRHWNEHVLSYINVTGSEMPQVDNRYRALIPELVDDTSKMQLLSKYYREAKELVSQLEMQIRVLSRIGEALVHTNAEFFCGERTIPEDVSLLQLYSKTGIYPSDIRMVIEGKYLEYRGNVYSLEYFVNDPGKYRSTPRRPSDNKQI